MIKFDVQFKPSAEWERQFADKQVTALEQTAAALYSDLVLSQTVPFDTGSLQNVLTYPDYTAAKDGRSGWSVPGRMPGGCTITRNTISGRTRTRLRAVAGLTRTWPDTPKATLLPRLLQR
jgi:hypothetical protein